MSNCLSCGRIVCEQEGSGPCFTCGQPVLSNTERQALRTNQLAKKQTIENSVLKSGQPSAVPNNGLKDIAAIFDPGLEKAVQHKNQLLEFDQNSSVRTKVIDDENDYFSLVSQNWISNENRKSISTKVEELHENKLKKNKKILINFAEHSATDYSEPVVKDFDQQIQQLYDKSQLKSDYETVDASLLIDENSHKNMPPLLYLNNKNISNERSAEDLSVTKRLIDSYGKLRIQDKELMEICDEGMCLSVGQPFASLLVWGIKRYEGRNWYSPFRGRLWIHSNSKKPNEELIRKVEKLYGFAGVQAFPPTYPLSSLVGCVTVTDCLPIEEYRQKYPDSEADDNYIFVCEDFKKLSDPLLVVGGGHRIYKLDEKIHSLAKKLIDL